MQVVMMYLLLLRKTRPRVFVQIKVLWSLRLEEQVSLDDIYMKELGLLLHRKMQQRIVVQVGVLWSLFHRKSRSWKTRGRR